MRILEVRFKNLNSLVGEWKIDLTHPAFIADGIFAITGPTGAGKTTILDAICLALYGRTPRLSKVTKSGNEIMSRQSAECFAEVTFETQAGCFRCHWSQHRARKKPDGELQAPKHEISNADTGAIFESRLKGVADEIETVTGMDFDRFTRSMLLAQGGFAAFLQANPDERAPILEQLTGTEIYSRISIRIHERQREEQNKLTVLQAETAGILILDPEQEKETQQALAVKQKEETDLNVKLSDAKKAIDWLTNIEGIKQEICSLSDEEDRLQTDIDIFKPERAKLSRALNAASLDGPYAMLTASRKQQMNDQSLLKAEEEALPLLESAVQEQDKLFKLAEQQTVKAKEEVKTAAPLIQKVRLLDQKLADQKQAVLTTQDSCQSDAAKIEADKQTRLKEQEQLAQAEQNLGFVDLYLQEHAQDERLISELTGIEEQLGSLASRQKEMAQKEGALDKSLTALNQATQALENIQKHCGVMRQALDEASNKLQQGKEIFNQILGNRLLREVRTERDTLLREMAFLSRIAELEDYRARLEDNQPCPLCGAKEHPFAKGNVPVPDETEQQIAALSKLISDAEAQEAMIKNLETHEATARQNLADGEKQEATAANEQKAAENAIVEVKEELEKRQAELSAQRQAVVDKLVPLGIEDVPETDASALLESLKERLNAWQAQVKTKGEIQEQITTFTSEIKRLDAVLELQRTALAGKQENLEGLKKAHAAASDERKALYGDKNPDTEETRINTAVTDAEIAEKEAREQHHAVQQKRDVAKTQIETLTKRIALRAQELAKLENDFLKALEPAGFSDEEQFLAGRLIGEQRDELAEKAKALDDRKTALNARRQDRQTHLELEIAKKVTEKRLEDVELESRVYENCQKELRDAIASLQNQLTENTLAKARISQKQTAIEGQRKECRRWDDLHHLIGSADGKKYRNFAQGLTFERMIGLANRQLHKMTDRYLLLRDRAQPLELNVMDNYQAGEIRSTKNLSGGESFIVSLALALGLSNMASQNVRVDSLFLDEGFGTLDEEALGTALETLAGLQREGKLIGVISHVATLKERISTQIQVTRLSGGRSHISGPGCNKLGA